MKLVKTLKILAIFSVLLFSYPIVSALLLITKQQQGALSFLYMLPLLFWGFFGVYFRDRLSQFVQQKKGSVLIRKLLTILFTILPLCSFFLLPTNSFLLSLTMGILSATAFLVGSRCAPRSFREIYHAMLFLWGTGIHLICLALLWFWKFSHPCPYQVELFVIVYLIQLFCYLLIQNQANIDYLMERRKHRLEHLPKKIRYYNILLLIILFAGILLLFLFKNQIVWLLELFQLAGKQLIVAFLSFLSFLSTLFQSDAVSPPIQQESPGELSNGGAVTEGYEWLAVFVLVTAIVFLVIYRKPIFNWLRQKFTKLVAIITKLLFREKQFASFQQQNDYYYDHTEDLSSSLNRISKTTEQFSTMRQWKKACKKYFKIKDPVERFRYGYRMANCWLSLKGAELIPSDTTLEILQKGELYYKNTISRTITENYNQYRYQELPLSPDSLPLMDQLLRNLISQS